jgi:hypothetical protein
VLSPKQHVFAEVSLFLKHSCIHLSYTQLKRVIVPRVLSDSYRVPENKVHTYIHIRNCWTEMLARSLAEAGTITFILISDQIVDHCSKIDLRSYQDHMAVK